jgi:hypothetical protein
LYGALDHLSFFFLNDWFVPHVRPLCWAPCGRYGHDA